MEWLGLVCLGLILCCSSSGSSKIKKLERKIKKLNRREEKSEMSKLISGLVGKRCHIISANELAAKITADVIDADDEWVKLKITDKKNNIKTKIIRIDSINEIELAEE